MNKKLVSLAIGLSMMAPGLVGAQSTTPNEPVIQPFKAIQEIRETKREELKDLREETKEADKDLRERMKEEQEKAKEDIKNFREETQKATREKLPDISKIKTSVSLPFEDFKAFQEKREAMKAEFETKREEAKKIMEVKREEAKQLMEVKREEFKQKLEGVKDQRKKEVAEKLFEDLNKLNTKATDNMVKAVDQIEGVLNRILNRSEKAFANGENITGVIAAGEAAKIAIRETRTAIQTQAAKVYSASATTNEATLKTDLGGVRNALRSDLEVVKSKVKSARDAVQAAAVSLAQIPKIDELEVSSQPTTGTSSTSNSATGTVEAGSGVEPAEPAVQ